MFLSRAAEGAPVRTGAEADQAHRIGRLWRHHGFADSAEIARSKLRNSARREVLNRFLGGNELTISRLPKQVRKQVRDPLTTR